MSNEAINWAFRQDVPMARKFVLIVLANYADESHSCYPGQKKIAAQIGSSVETVRRALADLEAGGLIRRQRRNRESGHRSTDRYVLPVDEPTGQFEGANEPTKEEPKVTDPAPADPPTGQFAYKAESGSLPVNLRKPTPQSEGANEPSVKPKEKPKVATPGKPAKGSRLTDDFKPNETQLEWARANAPGVDVNLETAQFIDHHIAKGSVMKDWGRAWQTWMRNSVKFSRGPAVPVKPKASLWDQPAVPPDWDAIARRDEEERKRAGRGGHF